MNQLESQSGRIMQRKHDVDWFGYADDKTLIFEDHENLEKETILLNNIFEKYHLKLNLTKTKTIMLNYQYLAGYYPNELLKLNGTVVKNVQVFEYLGIE